jgi:hypothetical protein
MIPVPLRTFVDFCCSTTLRRVAIVRDLKRGGGYDFYASFLAAVVDFHSRSGFVSPHDVATKLHLSLRNERDADRRKDRIYGRLIEGYAKTLAEMGPTRWATAEQTTWQAGELHVVTEADLSLFVEKDLAIEPRPYLLALHTSAETIAESRADLTTFLLKEALEEQHPGALYGVLDVQRSKLVSRVPSKPDDLRALARAEAQAFTALWAEVS